MPKTNRSDFKLAIIKATVDGVAFKQGQKGVMGR